MRPEKNSGQVLVVLLLILILVSGAVLRIHGLGDKDYWLDEELSVHYASLGPHDLIANAQNDPHPPLYYLLLHFWIRLFGDSESSTRMLSALFGLVSVFMMYHVGRILFNKETGIISSLILAVSAVHILYSQETRMYSLFVMLTLSSMYFFVKLTGKRSAVFSLCYLLSSSLLVYSHIYGLFVIAAQNLYVVSSAAFPDGRSSVRIREWGLMQLALLVIFFPWILELIRQLTGIQAGTFGNLDWLVMPGLDGLSDTFLMYAYYSLPALLLFLALALSPAILPRRMKAAAGAGPGADRSGKSTCLLVLWLLVPIVLPYLISRSVLPIYAAKYTVVSSLALYILAARGASVIRQRYVKGAVLLVMIYLSFTSVAYLYSERSDEPWREVADHIENHAGKGEIIVVEPYYAIESMKRYTARGDLRIMTEDQADLSSEGRVWYVYRSGEISGPPDGYVLDFSRRYGDLTLYLFEKEDLPYAPAKSHVSTLPDCMPRPPESSLHGSPCLLFP